jgi:hypothetical protein
VWLALRRRCWNVERLLRHGLQDNIHCSLCGVHDETLDHHSLQCPFAAQVWFGVAQHLGLSIMVPLVTSLVPEWWPQVVYRMSKQDSKKAISSSCLQCDSCGLSGTHGFLTVLPCRRIESLLAFVASGRLGFLCRHGHARGLIRLESCSGFPKGEPRWCHISITWN